jgi:hypothetical protein
MRKDMWVLQMRKPFHLLCWSFDLVHTLRMNSAITQNIHVTYFLRGLLELTGEGEREEI